VNEKHRVALWNLETISASILAMQREAGENSTRKAKKSHVISERYFIFGGKKERHFVAIFSVFVRSSF
jgi:hypothetical protein